MKDVIYRGTVLSNVKDRLVLLSGLKEISYLYPDKFTLDPDGAVGYAYEHFVKSGKDRSNPPCILALNGSYAKSSFSDGDYGVYMPEDAVPLNENGLMVINPLNRGGLELLFDLIRKRSHPKFKEKIKRTLPGRSLKQKLELYIEHLFFLTLKKLEEEWKKSS